LKLPNPKGDGDFPDFIVHEQQRLPAYNLACKLVTLMYKSDVTIAVLV